MAEYIERGGKLFPTPFSSEEHGDYRQGWNHCLRAIYQMPAADVVERKLGVWIWDDEGYHCSECFFHTYGCTGEILSGDYHFCPHCGAKMDGGQDGG